MARELSEAEARMLLTEARVGRLGCIDGDEPYVVPINYVFETDIIYSHSLEGRKIDALRSNPKACLQVDAVASEVEWRSVIASGTFEEVRTPNERGEILRKLLSRFPKLTPVESVMARDAAAPDPIIFRIHVERITGVAEE